MNSEEINKIKQKLSFNKNVSKVKYEGGSFIVSILELKHGTMSDLCKKLPSDVKVEFEKGMKIGFAKGSLS